MRSLSVLLVILLSPGVSGKEYTLESCKDYLELELIDLAESACKKHINDSSQELLRKIGVVYLRGEPAEKRDYNLGVKYIHESIKAGNIGGFAYLGFIHLYGIEEIELKDASKAITYFELGAKYGCRLCAANLGAIYYEDRFVSQDIDKAKAYLEMVDNLEPYYQSILAEINKRTHNKAKQPETQ